MRDTVGVVVLSYNRPRWLREALSSIQHAAQIVVADDGSTFDVDAVVAQAGLDADVEIVRNPPIPVAERMRVPRVGRLVNRAVERIDQPIVTYLCDDDLFAPSWLPSIVEAFRNTGSHMVRGDWLRHGTDESLMPINDWFVTTGNFAHLTACAHDEDCWWSEQTVAVHDAIFLTNYLNRHQYRFGASNVPHVGAVAGWRREHAFNMIHYTAEFEYLEHAASVLGGSLEEDLEHVA